jgi:hypothetical protein
MTAVMDPDADGAPMAPDALLSVDPAQLPGQWVDAGLSAQFEAANRQAWQVCRWMLECSRAKAGTRERVTGRKRAGKIVAASLGWSEGYAASRIEFARQVLERLPRLGEWMRSGRLEERKAADIVELVADLDDAQAREVVDRVLEAAPGLAFTALRLRVAREAAAVDPGWAERRRAAAIACRRVTLRSAPSGAAELCGLDLPEDPAQDSHDRIVALGRAVSARLKRAGVTGVSVGQVESEVMLTLTGPAGAGMFDLDVVDHVSAHFGGPTDNDDLDDGPDNGGPDNGGPDSSPDGEGGPDDHGGPDDNSPDDNSPDDNGGPAGRDHRSARTGGTHLGGGPAGPRRSRTARATAPVVAFRPRTVLRLELRTVLGLDGRPGELPGRGMIINSAAVAMAWARTHGRWRITLYDDDGALEHVLSVRPPATGPPPAGDRRRHHVVEITAHTRDLEDLRTALDPARSPAQLAEEEPLTARGDPLEFLRRAARALARERARPSDEHPARTSAEAGSRFPSTRLRDWVTARDRTCRTPGCAADATGCDLDHTLAVIDGGRTVAGDLGPFCRGDHLFKHDPDNGWSVVQPRPGRFEWTSPTGRVHVREPEPYIPLPDPVARTGPPPALLDHERRPGLPGRPRPNKHGLVTDASLATAAHLHRRARRSAGEPVVSPDEPPF